MGGFVICKDGQPVQTLSIPHFKHLLVYYNPRNPRAKQLPSYPPSPHSPPRSKQRASRIVSDLFITKLEAISATLVLATACILFFVWQKPLDARYPILINPIINLETLHDPRRIPQRISVKRDLSLENKLSQMYFNLNELLKPHDIRLSSLSCATSSPPSSGR